MTNRNIKLLYPFKNSSYQTFLQDMADALINAGYEKISGIHLPWKVRLGVAKLGISRNIQFLSSRTSTIIVLGAGYIDSFAFPYAYNHEIIPILWDTWPRYWTRIIKSFKRHHVKLAFFTQSEVAKYIGSQLPYTKCIHIPEGLNSTGYKLGKSLTERNIDILEIGRTFEKFHNCIVDELIGYTHQYPQNDQLLFSTFDELTDGLADAKITICFPRCLTHPKQAGNIETLTQRYWECMFSRSLILGHAPRELIDLLGYNPVIEVDWKNIRRQVISLLQNIEKYQELVDKNFQYAKEKGTWESRINAINTYLIQYHNK